VVDPGKFIPKVQAYSVPSEGHLPALHMDTFLVYKSFKDWMFVSLKLIHIICWTSSISLYTIYSILPSGKILYNNTTISQLENWQWYTPPTLLRFHQFYVFSFLYMHDYVRVWMCMCIFIKFFTWMVSLCNYHHDQYINCTISVRICCKHSYPLISNFLQSLNFSISLKLCCFEMLYKWNPSVCDFWLWLLFMQYT
jgi:hypothetical protein